MKMIKIFLSFVALLLASCKPEIAFENSIQKEKSNVLMQAIDGYIKKEGLVVGWLPVKPRNCSDKNKYIDQKDCINLILEVHANADYSEVLEKLKERILLIKKDEYKILSGVNISITVVTRKPNCQDAPITPYGIRNCFFEKESLLINIGE